MSLYGSNKFLASAGGGGVPIYPNLAGFPATATTGALGVAADTGILYEFNGTTWQPIASNASYLGGINAITGLTGDGTATGPGNVALTLATVNANVGSFGSAANSLTFTVNGKGLITAASAVAIQITESQVTNLVTDLASKVNTSSLGNLTDAGTDGIIITGGTGAVVGNVSIAQTVSDATHNGYLSATDWATFNAKQVAGNYITALTGDATASGPGSVAITLATVNPNVGTFGTSSDVPVFTVNGKGLITALVEIPIQIAESQVTNLVSDLAGKQPVGNYIIALTGDVTAAGPGSAAATLATVNANVGSFAIANITVNGKGLITAASASATIGTGNVVLATSPTLVTPVLGVASATSLSLTNALTVPNGGTGQQSFTINQVILGGTTSTGALQQVTGGGSGTVLTSTGTTSAPTWQTNTPTFTAQTAGTYLGGPYSGAAAVPTFKAFQAPTIQRFTTGSGTYTPTTGALWIRLKLQGGGGGGGGSGTPGAGIGGGGNATTFGTMLGNGGQPGGIPPGPTQLGGAGGTATGGNVVNVPGQYGGGNTGGVNQAANGGGGGDSMLGFGIMWNTGSQATPFGGNQGTGFGCGGSGASSNALTTGGTGGGGGGYIEHIMSASSASGLSYAVGFGGTAGAAGTGGSAGGAGAPGIIIVEEYYQ